MTHKQWEGAIRPKVNTSWNLHLLLPHDMDFLVLISSLAGVYGSPSQCNYAAGNSFLNALARMRASQDCYKTTVSIDLGWMQKVGIIAERAEYRRFRERIRDMVPLQEEDLFSVLEHYCDLALPRLTPEKSQILLGMMTPIDFLARGEQPPRAFNVPLLAPFDALRSSSSLSALNQGKGSDGDDHMLMQAFRQANDLPSRSKAVVQVLKKKLTIALSLDSSDEIDVHRGVADYGVDSLIALELRTLISQSFGVSVAVFEIMGAGLDIAGLGEMIAKKVEVENVNGRAASS